MDKSYNAKLLHDIHDLCVELGFDYHYYYDLRKGNCITVNKDGYCDFDFGTPSKSLELLKDNLQSYRFSKLNNK